jgi:hypothetical protein
MLQPKSSLKKMNGSSAPEAETQGQDKKNAPGKIGSLIRKAKEKATSLYNKSAGRTVSSVSKSFDGKEVQGKRVDVKSPGIITPMRNTSKEVYKIPGAGKHVEKTKYNMKGDVVSKKVKDTNVNPSNSSIKRENRIEAKIQKLKGKLGQ